MLQNKVISKIRACCYLHSCVRNPWMTETNIAWFICFSWLCREKTPIVTVFISYVCRWEPLEGAATHHTSFNMLCQNTQWATCMEFSELAATECKAVVSFSINSSIKALKQYYNCLKRKHFPLDFGILKYEHSTTIREDKAKHRFIRKRVHYQ